MLLFLLLREKGPDDSNLREQAFILAYIGTVLYGGEVIVERASYIASLVRKQRILNALAQLTFSFLFTLGP